MNVAYLACGGWIASAVASAAELGVADRLADGPKTVEELAELTGTAAPVLLRLLRVLTMLDVFAEDEHGQFSNTEDSSGLLTANPRSVRHFCMLAGGMYQRAFGDLGHTLKTGEPAPWKTFGGSIYQFMEGEPALADVYDRGMEDLSRATGPALAAAHDFSGVHTVMDIGGGRGTLVKGLLRHYPAMRGMVLDRGSVSARAAADLLRSDPDLADRLIFHSGDFFEPLPDADVYVLKNIVHNWNDDSALAILARVSEALDRRPDSRLLVIEAAAEGSMPNRYRRLDDLMQVVICQPGALARTEGELRRLVEQAGLRVVDVFRLATKQTVIEAAVASRRPAHAAPVFGALS